MTHRFFLLLTGYFFLTVLGSAQSSFFHPGQCWPDTDGVPINAHGGGILFHEGTYYWFGEYRHEDSHSAHVGVSCYSSENLTEWRNEGTALAVSHDPDSPITSGSVIERPKVVYNKKTGKFVMYFHLELKGRGYEAAYTGRAVSDRPTGPYTFLNAGRVNPGRWPVNMEDKFCEIPITHEEIYPGWSDCWQQAVQEGMYVRRDFVEGQMSRDMTLFVDDDDKAYHIYSSEENLTLHIAELSDDYLSHTGRYVRVEPGGHNEAPAIFKKDGRYFMITSGCTGWDPNAARLLTADHIRGPWQSHPNPCIGSRAGLTFGSQGTFILPVQGREDAFIFMADRWTPHRPIDGTYVWLPVLFGRDGLPVLRWFDRWNPDIFDDTASLLPQSPIHGSDDPAWRLVWQDEFQESGPPDPSVWEHEHGFVRNQEHQWYQPQNAECRDGMLIITGRAETIQNPHYQSGSTDWRHNREFAGYTSSAIHTRGKKEFRYGRFEIRAKIPTSSGAWPAIWTLGVDYPWPSNGEIDIMEYYRIDGAPHILANAAWGNDRPWSAVWDSAAVPFETFTARDPLWAEKFHTWRMDWDENQINIYLDDELLNQIPLEKTTNGSIGEYTNPFRQSHYILLNLAIGGINGGVPDPKDYPIHYEIDYVRVFQKEINP